VARHADAWHSFADLQTFRHKCGVLARHCADIGRDPDEIVKSVGAPRRGDPAVTGPPLVEAGASLFTVGVSGPDYDLARLKSWIDWRDNLG
jgi:hypothetical protein